MPEVGRRQNWQSVGVSRKTINTVENGVFVPSTIVALKIAKAFDLPVEKLFSLDR